MRPPDRHDASCIRVFAAGELDLATVPALDAVMRCAEREADRVVLDLTELDFLDSSGAHLLVDANRRIRAQGGELLIAGATPMVRRTLELLGIARQLGLIDELTVRVDDPLDLVAVVMWSLTRRLSEPGAPAPIRVALDLRAMRPPGPATMQWLCGALDHLSGCGLTLTLVEPDPYLRRMLELHGSDCVTCSQGVTGTAALRRCSHIADDTPLVLTERARSDKDVSPEQRARSINVETPPQSPSRTRTPAMDGRCVLG